MKVESNLGKAREIENLGHGEGCFIYKIAKKMWSQLYVGELFIDVLF